MKKIGLFGGTFDPIHIGHIIVAEWVQDALDLQTVFFIPNLIHPFGKRKDITPAEHRLNMLHLAVKPFECFRISDYEIQKGDTLWNIAKQFYGSGAKHTAIFEANKEVIKDPDLIFPGQKIRIPKEA